MHSAALLTLLAVGGSVAAAMETIVQTSKLTRTLTVTHCAASYTDCPLRKTSAAATTSAASTSTVKTSAEVSVETSAAPLAPSTTAVFPTANTTIAVASTGSLPGSSTTGPVLVPTGAASGLQAQSGAAAAVVAAVIAMVC